MNAYLLDTNVLSEPLKPQPNRGVTLRIQQHVGVTATAAMVVYELVGGYLRMPPSHRRDEYQRYIEQSILARIEVLPYDRAAAEWHAAERARLERLGRTPPYADGQIAAIAAVNRLTLVTANVRDFTDFRDLMVVDWRA